LGKDLYYFLDTEILRMRYLVVALFWLVIQRANKQSNLGIILAFVCWLWIVLMDVKPPLI